MHAVKAYRGSGGVVPSVRILDTRLSLVVSFKVRSLYPRFEEEKTILLLLGYEPQIFHPVSRSLS